eukprot:gnl/MRDRNA2_/MRDRNA2_57321_c0_seq1.p1 gnl/MRDRNA2_/MRDRNA2_57321_c0~~gnl/MRDRNA2_/MRDRNA2_57321_c0_seq1.p1  ORF type:complete len:346 (+),score=59.47 gnl/MRDRNA2_/MRDRNA2_57321_c0_seq1:83-1120(+)
MGQNELPEHFIPIPECEKILATPLKIMACVDGSELAESGLEYTLSCLVQQDKRNECQIVHIYDDTKEGYLPVKWRKATIEANVESRLVSAVSKERGRLKMMSRAPGPVSVQILDECEKFFGPNTEVFGSNFLVMGFLGRKRSGVGRATAATDTIQRANSGDLPISSNNMAVLGKCTGSVIIMQKEITLQTRDLLPLGRPGRFVVSVSLNAASTKAFLDALQLSKPDDVIDVVYVKSFMEKTESDYTRNLREKYDSFFSGLKGTTDNEQFVKFGDRKCNFVFLTKRRGKTTAQMITDYADSVEADFVVVGTNTMRLDRGKPVLGSVSADIICETSCNIVVSHYTPK